MHLKLLYGILEACYYVEVLDSSTTTKAKIMVETVELQIDLIL